MNPGTLFLLIWLGWAVSWIVAALWTRRTMVSLPWRQAWSYRVVVSIGTVLSLYVRGQAHHRLWHVGLDGAYVLAGLTFAGLGFAWWARIWLGSLWSSSVTRKEDHRVIDTGPYGLVRHPIYTGILGAALATTVAKATLIGILGFAFLVAGLWMKARFEEGFLQEQLDGGAYAAYRARVPMLVPWI
jgi:protein-S-isoprenylcysteine O-methyltransferase Ste14